MAGPECSAFLSSLGKAELCLLGGWSRMACFALPFGKVKIHSTAVAEGLWQTLLPQCLKLSELPDPRNRRPWPSPALCMLKCPQYSAYSCSPPHHLQNTYIWCCWPGEKREGKNSFVSCGPRNFFRTSFFHPCLSILGQLPTLLASNARFRYYCSLAYDKEAEIWVWPWDPALSRDSWPSCSASVFPFSKNQVITKFSFADHCAGTT